ncbi:MAG: motility protein A [Clostridiales bacterium]|nr:motility protein A [Clostridiales bacterium]
MKKSDALTGIGLVIGIVLMIWGMNSSAGYAIFWDYQSIFITVGGSLGAVLVSINNDDLKKLGKLFVQSFKEKKSSNIEVVNQFSALSKRARKEGLLSLEDDISKLDDAFLKKGLQMVVDGIEPDTIKSIMELEIEEMESRHNSSSAIFSMWGAYAPAFGMLGTLIGLIQMLVDLSDAASIGAGMGKALITTFYGSILANMFCNPIAANLARKSSKEVKEREMMLEGILAIQSGVNPRIVEEKLLTYLEPNERIKYLSTVQESSEGVV